MTLTIETQSTLRRAVERAKRKQSVGLPIGFVRGPSAPLQEMLRGGRGGGVRVALYLTLVMRATKEPYTLSAMPAASYARLLGLHEPATLGARRISQAMKWLTEKRLILVDEAGRGRPPIITVLDPAGGGGRRQAREARYITIPIEMWSQGWIAVLSGRALAMYVVLRELTGGRPAGASADRHRKSEYGLSDDTWARACSELESHDLLVVDQWVDVVEFGRTRTRNRYQLVDEGLKRDPFGL
jgi:hypothetical protein